jgi:hypothetical protein
VRAASVTHVRNNFETQPAAPQHRRFDLALVAQLPEGANHHGGSRRPLARTPFEAYLGDLTRAYEVIERGGGDALG